MSTKCCFNSEARFSPTTAAGLVGWRMAGGRTHICCRRKMDAAAIRSSRCNGHAGGSWLDGMRSSRISQEGNGSRGGAPPGRSTPPLITPKVLDNSSRGGGGECEFQSDFFFFFFGCGTRWSALVRGIIPYCSRPPIPANLVKHVRPPLHHSESVADKKLVPSSTTKLTFSSANATEMLMRR